MEPVCSMAWIAPLSRLLGHEHMSTTQIYLHANLQLKEQARAKTEPSPDSPAATSIGSAFGLPPEPLIMPSPQQENGVIPWASKITATLGII